MVEVQAASITITKKTDPTTNHLTLRIHTTQEAAAAAHEQENRAERNSNVTYTAPTETGEVETTTDPATQTSPVPRVGRNDPCPCGSGKKYKHCHGRLD